MIFAANVADHDLAHGNAMTRAVDEYVSTLGGEMIAVSAQVESELTELAPDDRLAFLQSMGVSSEEQCGLRLLTGAAFKALGLQTYFTSGPTETRAWTIRKGATAPQVSGGERG